MIRRIGGDSSPHLEQVGCTSRWRFVSTWRIDVDDTAFVFFPGFEFDRASIPALVPPWICSRDNLGTAAPAVHDALYRYAGAVPDLDHEDNTPEEDVALLISVDPYRTYTRSETDEIFREILLQRGVPRWRAWAAWAAVRVAGWAAWKS